MPDLVVPPISPEKADTTKEPAPAPKVRDEGKRVEVRLPAPLDQLAVGAGGDYLVLRLPKLQKLAIFDTRKLKVLKYLSSPEDALFAVGREKLVVLNVKQSILQRYDLATGERELSITSPVSNAGAMVMGAASEGPLLVRLGGGDLDAGSGLVFIDLRSLKKLPVTMEDQGLWRRGVFDVGFARRENVRLSTGESFALRVDCPFAAREQSEGPLCARIRGTCHALRRWPRPSDQAEAVQL